MANCDTQIAVPRGLSFDLERLLSDLEGDLERARELILAVATELPGHTLHLRASIDDGDFERVRIYARRLANLFGSLLACEASDAARRLQSESARRSIGQMRTALSELEQEVDRLLADLSRVFRVGAAEPGS